MNTERENVVIRVFALVENKENLITRLRKYKINLDDLERS